MDLSGAAWRKSSRSGTESNCVEVAFVPATWRKSSRSAEETNCVEVAGGHGVAAVRDSKAPSGPVLTFARTDWTAFVARVKHGAIT